MGSTGLPGSGCHGGYLHESYCSRKETDRDGGGRDRRGSERLDVPAGGRATESPDLVTTTRQGLERSEGRKGTGRGKPTCSPRACEGGAGEEGGGPGGGCPRGERSTRDGDTKPEASSAKDLRRGQGRGPEPPGAKGPPPHGHL